ncbi:pyrroline-5-carboxylate reductase [Bacillus sp. CGMCC 1.16541]|uniref:pyrroline-5-carboxylate reductase n=1 Tax=Bacillus sp. CGMCC 1.16541 TaxID=2185143 RepID=UPI000D73C384|nr:pyrroline-5-carboxylate reductase [Bacillus sp. CGMCC 1.16541]
MTKKPRLLFIGAGRMAQAIIAGLVPANKDSIIVTNNGNVQRLAEVSDKYGIVVAKNWRDEVKNVDVVVLAMPPQAHGELLTELSHHVTGQLVVTVAAGIGPSYMEERLPKGTPVAWIMPNTAAMIGESMSLYAIGQHVTDMHKEVLVAILNGIGQSQLCTEEVVHHLTAITGSAPAFFYSFTEALISKEKQYGVDESVAKQLVIQMVYGSSLLLKREGNPAELREQVTTPGGATAEGLKVMKEYLFAEMMGKAIDATNKKAMGK